MFDTVFSFLIINVWHPHNDIQTGVVPSPLSNFDKIEKSKMVAIAICAFIQNDRSRKIIDLDFGAIGVILVSYVSDTKESFGIGYLHFYGVTLPKNPILLPNM